MALGTYDREEEKKKVSYNPNGTTSEEKDDRSAGQIDVAPQNVAVAPTQAAPAPQVQNVGTVKVPQQPQLDEIKRQPQLQQASTPPQDSDTSLESQGGVNSDAGKENQQGQVQQDTPQMQELYPDETQGVKDGNATPVATGTDFTNSDDMPQNTGVKVYNGFNFSTVTADGKSLSDTDIEGYYNMLLAKSKETGMPVEEIDKALGNNLISAPEQKAQPPVESAKNDNITTNEGKTTPNLTGDTGQKQGGIITKMPPSITPKETKVVTPDNAVANAPSAEDNGKGGSAVVTGTPTEDDYYNGWKDWNVDDLKAILPANSDNPEKKAAIERLIKEKGGEVAPAQENVPAASSPKYTAKQQAKRDNSAKEMTNKDVYNGNVDLLSRKSVDAATMRAAGYDVPDGQSATVYSMQSGYKDKTGKEREILYTPITADGKVLSEKELDDYFKDLGSKGDILELDKPENGGKGLVIAIDVKEDLGPRLHELQEQYYMTPEQYAAKGKEAEGRISALGGNQNPIARKPVSKRDMVDAGWTIFNQYPDEDIYAHPIQQIIVDADGKVHKVIMTPITKDGDILSPERFDSYVSSLQNNSNIMDADGKDSGLILKYDAEDGDGNNIYDDIESWRQAQPDKDETQGKPLGDLYKDDTERKLVEEIERAQKNAEEFYDKYLGPNASWMEAATKANQDKLKEEGLDEESEKRLEKRRKTAGLIANIGDILQGFANLAGAWYGAKSSDLTSLSAAAQAGNEKVDAKRQKRKDELQQSFDKAKKKDEDYYMKLYLDMKKANERLENQLFGYRVSRGKTEQRYQLSEEKAQRDAERKRKEQDRKHQQDIERDEKKAKQREDLAKLNSSLRRGDNDHATANRIKVKQTPGGSSKKGGKGGNKGKQSEGSLK